MKHVSLALIGTLSLFAAKAAHAQDTSVGGSVSGTTTSTVTTETNNNTSTLPKPATTTVSQTTTVAPAAAEGPTDHEQVVGHLAVGYFGASQIPVAGLGTVTAPFVGVRYWLNDMIGIDAALGFRTQSGSSETVNGNTNVTTDAPGVLGFGVKGGVPIALAHSKHFTFEIVPELLVAGATSTLKVNGQPDTSRTGSRIELGARAGAEIHFGFIGIPQLALQGSIGLNFARVATKTSQDLATGTVTQSSQTTAFGTTVQSDPWALFTNNIAALYYF